MDWSKRVKRVLKRHRVLMLEQLQAELGGRSRASIFRDLSGVDYLSSYSHNGKYFTLYTTPQFNPDGVWHYGEVGFSQHGTLKNTVVAIIEGSEAGCTHAELKRRLLVRVHNTLLLLVKSEQIRRVRIGSQFVYVSNRSKPSESQLKKRRELQMREQTVIKEIPTWTVVQILAEVIRDRRIMVNAKVIASRLVSRYEQITVKQVERVLDYFRVKKTPNSR